MEGQRTGVRKETKFSFRHDDDKRAKPTSPLAPNPEHSTPQDVTKSSENHKSWRSKSIWENFLVSRPSIISKVLVRIHLLKSDIPQSSCFTSQKRNANSVKSALMHTVGLRNSPVKGLKRMTTKSGVGLH